MVRLAIVFVTLGMLTMPVMGAVEIIDDFFGGPFTLTGGIGTYTNTGLGDPCHIIGGRRDTTFTVVEGIASLFCGAGALDYQGGQAWWNLEYGFAANLDADLTAPPEREQFSVDVTLKSIPDPVPLTLTVTSERDTPNEKTSSVQKGITGVGEIIFLYTEFDGVNFADVDYLKFKFDCTDSSLNGLHLRLGEFRNCPEPATLLLLGLGSLIVRKLKIKK